MPWRRSRLLQKYVKSADHAKSAIGTGAPCGPAAPCRAAASRFHIPVFHATFVPHAIPRPPHTWAASPYGIAVSPYNHTPDAFPHTSHQIPIGWSSPHMVSADPPNNTARSKKLILNSTRPADPAPQIPNQPCQADIQNLRHNPANQSPTGSSKSHMPATGGGVPSPPARTAMVMRAPSRARSLTRASSRPCSHLHAHTFTGMRISARPRRKPIRRDQRTAQQIPNQPCQANTLKLRNASTNLQSNCYSKPLGGMGDDDAATPATPATSGGVLLLHMLSGYRAWGPDYSQA